MCTHATRPPHRRRKLHLLTFLRTWAHRFLTHRRRLRARHPTSPRSRPASPSASNPANVQWRTGSVTRLDRTVIIYLDTPSDLPTSSPAAPQSAPAPAVPVPATLPSSTANPPAIPSSDG
eukprot:1987741-Pleurochrysis_carterae.AAC.1